MKVLIIIPAFNEEKNLEKLVYDIKKHCNFCDILIVNDCSKDNTRFISFEPPVYKIDLSSNLGIGGAVQTGYKFAYYNNYDIAIQVDGDGQHNPSYIEALIEEINKGANLCLGSRFIDKAGFQSTFARRMGITYFSKLIHLVSKKKITDPTSGFRACDRAVIKMFATRYPTDYPEPETLVQLAKKKLKIKEIPVIMNERQSGVSSINFIKSIYYMIKVSMAICFTSISSK
ncbi:glycosyltransferase family 2 protein [Clostridium sp. MSJ-4]|uniref:Glycosyltransferase family 2 protein n=1 Tax=Clostridium simiarum TaxID=2841506 RepID=A0ABS6EZ09_9CLOT|nr:MULTISPECIES: glycosyltransferase family 2 protein [Clostridium]MBU5591462.1 glycosyltransferase family 2 protein [Clostridium simiarum]